MRILCFVDLHDSNSCFAALKRKVKEKEPDLIICAGDMTIFSDDMEAIMKKIAKLNIPTLVLPGNHEEGSNLSAVCKKYENLIYFHKKTKVIDGILFMGHGGGGFSYEQPEFDTFIEKNKDKIKENNKIILLTHQPPYKTRVDEVYGGRHVGSKTYRRFIQKFNNKVKLCICGHIHECQGKYDTIGKTRVLNPGPEGRIVRTEFK